MVAFIKRRKDFRTYAAAEVVSWDVPLASIADDVGTIVLYGTAVTRGSEGDFLIMDGHIWLVEQVAPDQQQTTVTVGDVAGAFDRLLPFVEEGETIGGFLAQQLTDHYKEVSDISYSMPYLQITNLDNTEYLGPTVTDGLFNLRTYMRKVNRLRDVQVKFSIDQDKLNILIEPRQRPTHKIIFEDGTSQLLSRSYSRLSIAKVTAYQRVWGTRTICPLTATCPMWSQSAGQKASGKCWHWKNMRFWRNGCRIFFPRILIHTKSSGAVQSSTNCTTRLSYGWMGDSCPPTFPTLEHPPMITVFIIKAVSWRQR